MRVPFPDDLPVWIYLENIGASLPLFAASFSSRPPRSDLDISHLLLKLIRDRLMRNEQPVVVRQPPQVVDGTDAFVRPDNVAVPVVFDDRLVRPRVQQMTVGQQAAPLVEGRGYHPGVHNITVHVDETNVMRNSAFCPDPGVRMVAHGRVVRDEDVATVGLVRFVDSCASRKDRGVGGG